MAAVPCWHGTSTLWWPVSQFLWLATLARCSVPNRMEWCSDRDNGKVRAFAPSSVVIWLTSCPCRLAGDLLLFHLSRFLHLLQPIDFCIHQDFWLRTFKVHASVVLIEPGVHGVFVLRFFGFSFRGVPGVLGVWGKTELTSTLMRGRHVLDRRVSQGTVVHMGDKNKSYVNKVPSRRGTCMR